jgi:hypothetical protein
VKEPTPPSLRELQTWMRWIITDPRGVATLSTPVPTEFSKHPRYRAPEINCFKFIEARAPIANEERLSIYAEAYFARILETLTADFSLVGQSIGEAAFTKLIADYLKQHPSAETNIGEVGRHLPSFLTEHEFSQDIQFLPELARLEWLAIESFYANDVPAMELSALAQISAEAWAEARFELDPSVFLCESPWPVHELWIATAMHALEPKKSFILGYRLTGTVQVESIEKTPFKILTAMKRGKNLTEICTELSEQGEENVPLMEWFQKWISAGIIRNILTQKETPHE